eukprot:TRINITY_DN1119_c2_g4_i1.p1 TRINITY_DN1119_c2_g4~~TRINITY_DN1119_c2_g4_i1.p1  ORF type:complete len:416 (+),score=91.40 TRINITY_DN1119_c2_g4_i1:1-1248(+)
MSARPLVSVFSNENPSEVVSNVTLPSVFTAPIRIDIVQFVHTNLNKNKRQAHGVNRDAGMQHSAQSWGTGKAVARIPRVSGGGTRRASQGAFGNMCRKGRMFAPLHIWRRWHRRVNVNEKRHAVASAIAASGVPSLVMARGHRVMDVPEVPLVLDKVQLSKTKNLITLLNNFGAKAELTRVKNSKSLRTGKGKMRNRRFTLKRGPLLVHTAEESEIKKAARNIPGLDVCEVSRLNLLQLAPGGHVGRFIIWTQTAFKQLDKIFGAYKRKTEAKLGQQKTGYQLQRPILSTADLGKIINSEEVQKTLKPIILANPKSHDAQNKNPLKNREAMKKLNPFYEVKVQMEKTQEETSKKNRKALIMERRKKKSARKTWLRTFKSDLEEMQKTVFVTAPEDDESEEEEEEEDAEQIICSQP